MTKLIEGIYDLNIEKDLLNNIFKTDINIIQGSVQETQNFYNYVKQLKINKYEFKNLPDKIFIQTANIHNEGVCIKNYLKSLYDEIEIKLLKIFDILNNYSKIENKMFNVRVDGDVLFEGTIPQINIVVFSGSNSLNKLITIIMAAETLKPETIKQFDDYNMFYNISLFNIGYSKEKMKLLENHLKSLNNLRKLDIFKPLMRIDTKEKDYILKNWSYEFTEDELKFILELNRQQGVI